MKRRVLLIDAGEFGTVTGVSRTRDAELSERGEWQVHERSPLYYQGGLFVRKDDGERTFVARSTYRTHWRFL